MPESLTKEQADNICDLGKRALELAHVTPDRIVACVRACQGFSTEELENMEVGDERSELCVAWANFHWGRPGF